jgi:hypothetical protein
LKIELVATFIIHHIIEMFSSGTMSSECIGSVEDSQIKSRSANSLRRCRPDENPFVCGSWSIHPTELCVIVPERAAPVSRSVCSPKAA